MFLRAEEERLQLIKEKEKIALKKQQQSQVEALFDQGKQLFTDNKPRLALDVFRKVLAIDETHQLARLYSFISGSS